MKHDIQTSSGTINMNQNQTPKTKDPAPELKNVLMAIGRGLGTVSVYGTEHPSLDLVISQTFNGLKLALADRSSISLGIVNGRLAVDGEPLTAREVPIRTLEKRLLEMKITHLSLNSGLSEKELKALLKALCAPSDSDMKDALSGSEMEHIKLEDVEYVTLRKGEKKVGSGDGEVEIAPAQIQQIVAFLKGEPDGGSDSMETMKKALSDTEKLAQLIMEAAAIRQADVDARDGETLADIVIGCLRRTYGGLRKEKAYQSARGRASLSKAMMLLEKNVLEKIHKALGEKHPDIDERIMNAVRQMDEERQFEKATADYLAQVKKSEKAESKVLDAIRAYGAEQALQQLKNAGIPQKEWQKLMVQVSGSDPSKEPGGDAAVALPGVDMSALAVVLEKLESLMRIDSHDPEQIQEIVNSTKENVTSYTENIESQIQQLEGQVELVEKKTKMVEDHADHLSREALMLEVSNLTLALLQPLTVVNASVEGAIKHRHEQIQVELLDLAQMSGQRMQLLTKRLMKLVGYPELEPTER